MYKKMTLWCKIVRPNAGGRHTHGGNRLGSPGRGTRPPPPSQQPLVLPLPGGRNGPLPVASSRHPCVLSGRHAVCTPCTSTTYAGRTVTTATDGSPGLRRAATARPRWGRVACRAHRSPRSARLEASGRLAGSALWLVLRVICRPGPFSPSARGYGARGARTRGR